MINILRKIIKFFKIAKKPYLFAKLIKYKLAASVEHEFLFKKYSINTVIDIGANIGQFALIANYYNRKCKIYSFEPLSEPFQKFNKAFSKNKNIKSFQVGISPLKGKKKINVSKKTDSSSFLKISSKQTKYFKGTNLLREEIVNCGPLSQFIDFNDVTGVTLMKIDVQGYELDVLKSSQKFLEKINYVYCEVSFEELYEQQYLANEIIVFLKENNFDIKDIRCLVYKENRLIQCDMLFENINLY